MRFRKLLDLLPFIGVGIVVFYLREIAKQIQLAEEVLERQAREDAAACPDFVDKDTLRNPYTGLPLEKEDLFMSSDHDEPDVHGSVSDENDFLIEKEIVIEFYDEDKPFAKMEDYSEEEIADIISQSLDIGEYNESDISFDPNTSLEEAHEALGPGGDRIVFAITPGGKVVSSFFSEDNMKLAKEVAEIEGKPLDDVLLETIAERYDMITNDDD